MTKEFNSLDEIQKYYDVRTNAYVFKENKKFIDKIVLNFDLKVESDIKARNIDALNIHVWNIYAEDIKSDNINACNIEASNIEAKYIIANYIYAHTIKALYIHASDLCEMYRNEVNIIKKDLDRLEKLEKVIEILKKALLLNVKEVRGIYYYILGYDTNYCMTKEEYELLKEELENE